MLTILNTSILTQYGTYTYVPLTLPEARGLAQVRAKQGALQSAVGHQSTADILTSLLDVPVPMNRIQYVQAPGEQALVFKLRGRPEEGKILSIPEIEALGYEFGLLARVEEG